MVDLHRVVDDQFDGLQRVHALRVAAELDHAVTHGREVDHGRDAREVLEQDAGGHERDLALVRFAGSQPASVAMSSFLTKAPSSLRSRFSSRMRSEYGSVATPGNPAASRAGRLTYSTAPPGVWSVVRAPKELSLVIAIGNAITATARAVA